MKSIKNIICEKRIYESKFDIHSHIYGQLIIPIKGKMYIETGYKQVELDDKKVFFLPPDCNHIFKADESNEFLTLDINKNILNKNDMYNFLGGKEIKFDEKWKAVRYLLLNESKDKNNSNAINNLFNYCYDLIGQQTMNKSVEYINEHFLELEVLSMNPNGTL